MTAYERLLDRLGPAVVRSNGHQATARCPVHGDNTPSLSITGIEGQTLIHCHAGCQTTGVVAALGLTLADLFDEPRRGVTYRYGNGRTVHRTPDKRFYQRNTDRPPELYRLDKVKAAVTADKPVFVVEGEKDVHALETLGVVATCAPMGAGKWGKVDPSPLYGGRVLIVADQDDAGQAHARDVLASLAGKADAAVHAPRVGKDAADHVAAGYGVNDFVPIDTATVRSVHSDRPGPVTVRLADVNPERVDWLWRGRLPRRKLVTLDSDPALGKSTLAVDWAARISTGSPWPDGAGCPRGDVLILSAEDGIADTIRPRLDAAGGDPARVHMLTEIRVIAEDGRPITRPPTLADVEQIEGAVCRHNAVLVVVDVLMAYLPGKVDSHRDQDVRGVLHRLAALAERTGCCILLLRHLSKAHGANAIYAGGGSIGIIGAARVGLVAGIDPDDDTGDRRILAVAKVNIAAKASSLAYRLVPHDDVTRVQWDGDSQHTADQLVSYRLDGDPEREQADELVTFLRMLLDDNGGQIPARDAIKQLRAEGMTPAKDTLYRARKRAGIVSRKSDLRGGWIWEYTDEGSDEGSEDSGARNPRPFRTLAEPSGADIVPLRGCPTHPGTPVTTDGKCPQCILDKIKADAP
jgi:putative DNA primase/helicase